MWLSFYFFTLIFLLLQRLAIDNANCVIKICNLDNAIMTLYMKTYQRGMIVGIFYHK